MSLPGIVSPDIQPDHWIYVFFLIAVYLVVSFALWMFGFAQMGNDGLTNPVRIFFRGISNALARGTGYPGWAMAGVLSALVMLGTAAMGLYWDVAWHIDLGRDRQLMTPSHTMIVVGLGGLIWAALIAIVFATNDEADVGFRVGGLRVPWSAVSLAALGMGGLVAFPFDAMWHDAYGIDITLWSPSHLMLIAGGSLATISIWLMIAEARRGSRPTALGTFIHATVAGATLVGMATFQGEFDFGVPQFQLLYWPLLVVIAGAFALVFARIALGPGGALYAMLAYVVLRTIIALLVGVALNHTVPRFPLYLVAALAVEGVALWVGTERRTRFAVAAGLAVATVGLAAEVAWAALSGWFVPAGGGLWATATVLVPVAAVAAALLGAGLSRAFSGEPVPGWLLGLAGVALVVAMAVPLPRNVGEVDAVIRLRPATEGDLVGREIPGVEQAFVEVDLHPADAARGAVAFGVASWQGGGRFLAGLEEVGPGSYVSDRPMPVSGDWKTTVGLFRGSEVMAAPVYLPADPEIGAPEVPALPERQTSFVRNTTILLREVKPGPLGPAVMAYTAVGVVTLVWIALFALAVAKASPGDDDDRTPPVPTPTYAPPAVPAWGGWG
jgi:hypothetical protein